MGLFSLSDILAGGWLSTIISIFKKIVDKQDIKRSNEMLNKAKEKK